MAEREAQQQHAKRIDIVGDAAVATPGRQAHRRIRRLEQRRLRHRRRRLPGGAEDHRLARRTLEYVVESDATMGHAAGLQLLEHVGNRAKHAFQQLCLGQGRDRSCTLGPGGARLIA